MNNLNETTQSTNSCKAGECRKLEIADEIYLEFIWIPAGKFTMGSETGFDPEKPKHTVSISKGFWFGKYPVTQAFWLKIMDTNPSHYNGLNCPVEMVSWEECQSFIKRLSQKTEKNFRLPTEAEWEYACRAGSYNEYFFGNEDDALDEFAWYVENSDQMTQPVGQKKPNHWNLHDIHGNVWEWCQDWYAADYFVHTPKADPLGPSSGDERIVRGGSWCCAPCFCRDSDRRKFTPNSKDKDVGLRLLALNIDE